MVAVEGDREGQIQDAVVRRQVVRPPERLPPQLDRRGEETEHGDQDRELDQHRDAPSQRIDARLLVEGHHLLLLLHRVVLLGILGIQGVDLGFDDAHLGLRDIALVSQRRNDDLDEDRQDEDDPAEARNILPQEIEDGDHQPAAHPPDNAPAHGDQPVEQQRLALCVVDLLQHGVLVGTEVEREVVLFGLGRIGYGHRGRKSLDKPRIGRCGIVRHVGVEEVVAGDEHRREELLLEGDPLHRRRDLLLLGPLAHRQVVDRPFARNAVGDRRVHVLVLETALVLVGGVAPRDADAALVGHVGGHPDQTHRVVDQIVARGRRLVVDHVAVFQRRALGDGQPHTDDLRRVGTDDRIGREGIFRRIDLHVVQAVFDEKRQIELRAFGDEHLDRFVAFALTAVTGIVFERHGAHDASSGRKAHLHHVVLYDDLLRRSVLGRGEEITQHGHFACQTSRIGRRRTERLHDRRCGHGRRIGDDGLRQFGMGRLISGQLLLIFLLLPGTVNRETEKQNPDKYDAYD